MKHYLQLANEIRELVSKDQLKEALTVLRQGTLDLSQLNEIILSEARFEALRKDIRNNTLRPDEVGIEKNRIRNNLLEVVRELEHKGRNQIQVFISYCQRGESHELAKVLHDHIESQGFVAFLDTEDIRPGEDWAEFILGSLKASDYFILLLSKEANTSEMVLKEVQEARRLKSKYGKPIILPVRVKWPENLHLNHKLSDWLQWIQQLFWEGVKDNESVIRQLMEVISERKTLRLIKPVNPNELDSFIEDISSPPLPEALLEIPQGSVLLKSPFYIERSGEKEFIRRIIAPKALLRIRGPRQYGKTSLLSRVVAFAKEEGCQSSEHGFSEFQ